MGTINIGDLTRALVLSAVILAGCLAPASAPFAPRGVAYTLTPEAQPATDLRSTSPGATDTDIPATELERGGESVTSQPTLCSLRDCAAPQPNPTPTTVAVIVPSPTPSLVPSTPVPAAPIAPPPVVASVSDTSSAEQAVIDLTNQQRSLNGLGPLMRDEAIMSISGARVQDMVVRDYFSHFDPVTGASLGREMILASGYAQAGENIYWSGSVDLPDFPARAVSWFMSDPPHAAAILSSTYSQVGVGIASNGVGWVLVQNFASP